MGSAVRTQMKKEFLVAGGAGEGGWCHGEAREAAGVGRFGDAGDDRVVHRRIRDDPAPADFVASRLELRLDEDAITLAAPRRSRTSVKPPVEAPMSSARRPRGSMANVSSACASLTPPRPTYGWSGVASATCASAATGAPALDTT
jgi:hypothetical protein